MAIFRSFPLIKWDAKDETASYSPWNIQLGGML